MKKRSKESTTALAEAASLGRWNTAVCYSTTNHQNHGQRILTRGHPELLATLLNSGTSPTTGARILKSETVTHMFENQIPQFPNFGRTPTPAVKPDYTNPIPELYPQPPEQPQGWGLTFMLTIHEGATGRGKNTAWWAGLPNLFWWCDRDNGIAGMVASQILPFAGEFENHRARTCVFADLVG